MGDANNDGVLDHFGRPISLHEVVSEVSDAVCEADARRVAGSRVLNGLSTVGRIARNAVIDLRFGMPLGAIYVRDRKQSNSDYRDLETIDAGRIGPGDVLVDVGCGAGRVINHWLRLDVPCPIFGLEIDVSVAAATRRRLRRRSNVTIITGDAVENLPPNGTVFFLFNPFDEATMRRFANAVALLAEEADRTVTILYLNCKYVAVFRDNPAFAVDVCQIGTAGPRGGVRLATITVRRA